MFSIATSPFPPTVQKGSNFFTFSPTFVIFCFSDSSHPDGCEVVFHCESDLHFVQVILFVSLTFHEEGKYLIFLLSYIL